MSRQLSQTKKAVIQRKSRRKNNERKRFEEPLRYYIEHKYNHIFSEYSAFYTALDRRYPTKRNLTKTEIFKAWLKTHPKTASPPDILTSAITETLGEGFQLIQQQEGEGIEGVEDTEANEAVASIIEANGAIADERSIVDEVEDTEANETVASIIEANGAIADERSIVDEAISEADEAIAEGDNIIQELLQNEDMRRALNQECDEGIELPLFDDEDILPFDIESFDYELEVEGLDW